MAATADISGRAGRRSGIVRIAGRQHGRGAMRVGGRPGGEIHQNGRRGRIGDRRQHVEQIARRGAPFDQQRLERKLVQRAVGHDHDLSRIAILNALAHGAGEQHLGELRPLLRGDHPLRRMDDAAQPPTAGPIAQVGQILARP